MFFILSKVLLFLLAPFWWIIILLVWRLLSKNQRTKKRLLVISIIILVVFTNPFLYRSVVMLWQPQQTTLYANQKFDAGIMLGGLARYDKQQIGHFNINADRFIQTANLYHRGIIKKIIVSGGNGTLSRDEPPEATFLRQELIYNGIPDADIIIENKSRNTSENAIFSKRISDSVGLKPPFVLVTSAMHMRRSVSVFRKEGFNCIPFPCDYKITSQKISLDDTIMPDIALLRIWSDQLKEMVGLCVYRLTGKA
jgi:uncharacterized SAM-binding protein YcdF (DUF218 family)